MGSMGLLLSPGSCLLLCFLSQLAAAASGDRGRVGQWGKSLWWGMLGLVSLPWDLHVTSLWDTSKREPSPPPQGALAPQPLNGLVSALRPKAGPAPRSLLLPTPIPDLG